MPLTPGKSPAKVAAEASNQHPIAVFNEISTLLADAIDAMENGRIESALNLTNEALKRSETERNNLLNSTQ